MKRAKEAVALLGKGRQNRNPSGNKILDVTASMQGSLVFQEPVALRISGRFEGTLETRGDLTIGDEAVVRADITGEAITIAGRVTGKVVAKRSLKIVPPAVVKGDIWTPVIEVAPGARIEGTLQMPQAGAWMMLPEVAEYLEVETRLIEQWAREGKIPAVKEGDQWRFEKSTIDEWVAAQKSS